MKARRSIAAAALLFAVWIAACGGAAKPAESPEPRVDTKSVGAPPPPPSAPSHDGPGAPGERQMAAKKASTDLESAQRELDQAGSDCKAACRALGSMDRAAGHLCEMSQTTDEHAQCDDAKAKVHKARDKVRAACVSCSGGPSVDRDAPIPSVK